MANAAICITNLADSGTWSASTAETLMPASLLQNEHIGKRWRSTASPATITCDLGADVSFDTVFFAGLTPTTTSIQLLLSTAAGGAASGDLNGGGVTYTSSDEEFDPNYRGAFVLRLSSPVSGRYVRAVLTDATLGYVEAGRGFVALSEAFTYNFVPGAVITWTDRSRRTETAGGQTLIFPDNKFRTVEVNFDFVPAAQRNGVWETMARVNGQSVDVLLILNTASDNLPRDSIFGLVVNPIRTAFREIADIYTAPLTVKERL
jgi:hypothetical protein